MMSPQMAVLLGLAVALVVFGVLLWKYDQPRGRGTVEVTITANTDPFTRSMSDLARQLRNTTWNLPDLSPWTDKIRADMQAFASQMEKVRIAANSAGTHDAGGVLDLRAWATMSPETPAEREVRVAGLAAKMQVRAGMDPTVELDTLLRQIRAHRNLTYEERALVAAAAIRGWAEHRTTGRPDSVAFNRLLCGHHVEVAAAVGGVS
jgi:hypothetical protein